MSETPELPPLPEPAFKPPYIPTAAVGAVGYMPVRVEAFTMRLSIGPTFTPEQVSAYGRECWDAGRRAGLEEAAKLAPVAPWPDFAGQPIHHGDRLRHPSGDEFIAVRLHGYAEESDAWRAIYKGEGPPSRLGLQIGDKGRAVVIGGECGGTGRAKP